MQNVDLNIARQGPDRMLVSENRAFLFFLFLVNKKMVIERHRADLFEDIYREFRNNCLWIYIDGCYREQKHFKEAILYLIFNIVELNPTDKVGSMIHNLLKSFFFEKPEYRSGVYKLIRYEILPILWKNPRMIGKMTEKTTEKTAEINVPRQRTTRGWKNSRSAYCSYDR